MANVELNKAELVALVCEHEEHIDALYAQLKAAASQIETMYTMLNEAETKVVVVEKPGRKDEVLAILKEGKHVSVAMLAKRVGISERNISSQMSYLRKDGWLIATDSRGNKFLEGKSSD